MRTTEGAGSEYVRGVGRVLSRKIYLPNWKIMLDNICLFWYDTYMKKRELTYILERKEAEADADGWVNKGELTASERSPENIDNLVRAYELNDSNYSMAQAKRIGYTFRIRITETIATLEI